MPIFVAQSLGIFNDHFFKNSLIILITFQSVSVLGLDPTQVVVFGSALFVLPFFLFSTLAGQLADKFEKAYLMRRFKLIEIFVMCLAGIGFLFGRYEFLLLVLFMMGMQSTFFNPPKLSILPQHLKAQDLMTGNALIETGVFLSILGGSISGVFIRLEGYGVKFVVISLVLISCAGWLASWFIPKAKVAAPSLELKIFSVQPIKDIFKECFRHKRIFTSILGLSWFWLLGAVVMMLLPSFTKEVVMGEDIVFTFFLALFSIGIGLGSLLCGKFSKGGTGMPLAFFGALGITIFSVDLYLIGSSTAIGSLQNPAPIALFFESFSGIRICVDLFLLAVSGGFYSVPITTLIQREAPEKNRARIIAGNNIINAIYATSASVIVMLLLNLNFSIPEIFMSVGLLNLANLFVLYRLQPQLWQKKMEAGRDLHSSI